jgi:hypothetical protein
MAVGVRAAENAQVLQVLGQLVGKVVEELVLVDRSARATFSGSAVVRAIENDGVVELVALLKIVDNMARPCARTIAFRRHPENSKGDDIQTNYAIVFFALVRYAPSFREECQTALTAAFSFAGVTLISSTSTGPRKVDLVRSASCPALCASEA